MAPHSQKRDTRAGSYSWSNWYETQVRTLLFTYDSQNSATRISHFPEQTKNAKWLNPRRVHCDLTEEISSVWFQNVWNVLKNLHSIRPNFFHQIAMFSSRFSHLTNFLFWHSKSEFSGKALTKQEESNVFGMLPKWYVFFWIWINCLLQTRLI